MNYQLKSSGILCFDSDKVYLSLCEDFCDYYRWFVDRHFWIATQPNKFKPHITLWRRQFGDPIRNKGRLQELLGKKINFSYSPDMRVGGSKKGFKNFYLMCDSPDFGYVEREAGFSQNDTFLGYHATISQAGKSGAVVKKYQPKMIELR